MISWKRIKAWHWNFAHWKSIKYGTLKMRKFKEMFKKTYEIDYKVAILEKLSLIYFLFVASCKIIELWKLLLFLGATCLQTGHL